MTTQLTRNKHIFASFSVGLWILNCYSHGKTESKLNICTFTLMSFNSILTKPKNVGLAWKRCIWSAYHFDHKWLHARGREVAFFSVEWFRQLNLSILPQGPHLFPYFTCAMMNIVAYQSSNSSIYEEKSIFLLHSEFLTIYVKSLMPPT